MASHQGHGRGEGFGREGVECDADGSAKRNALHSPLLELLAVSTVVDREVDVDDRPFDNSAPRAAVQQRLNAVECQLWAWEVGVVEAALTKGDEYLLLEAAALVLQDAGPAALTVKQPWARALWWGVKDVENRCYQLRLPASGGKWLALHAGASTDLLSDDTLFSKLSFESGFSVETWKDGIGDETGVLLGAMLISHVSDTLNGADSGPWAIQGLYSWTVQKVVRLPRPLAISGALGTWPLPAALRLLLALHIRASMPAPHRPQQGHEVSVNAWQRLDALVHAALQQRLEHEQDAERRRRDKLQLYRCARSSLGPGVAVEVHEMWLHARHQSGWDGGRRDCKGGAKRMLAAVCSARGSKSRWFCVKLLRHADKDRFLGHIVSEVCERAAEPSASPRRDDFRICARDGQLVLVALPRDSTTKPADAHRRGPTCAVASESRAQGDNASGDTHAATGAEVGSGDSNTVEVDCTKSAFCKAWRLPPCAQACTRACEVPLQMPAPVALVVDAKRPFMPSSFCF